MEAIINKKPNLFVVDIQKKTTEVSSKINQIITTKIKPNSIGADQLKAQVEYGGEDAEVWVFVASGAEIE